MSVLRPRGTLAVEPTLSREDERARLYLAAARKHRTQGEIAASLGVDVRTVRRWELGEQKPKPYIVPALQRLLPMQFLVEPGADFDFVDLFAGIGGIRLPFEELGGRCVFTSEWDAFAQRTYTENFSTSHRIDGDITKVDAADIPDHDVLLAGFPCQPFSIAGVSKKNALGRRHGFADETQGTLFFDVARIIAERRPSVFVLENVKNLMSHDGGNTYAVIMRKLREDLGYDVHAKVIDGAAYVPQHRERILIVGFRDAVSFDWNLLRAPEQPPAGLSDILHKTNGTEPLLEWDQSRYFDHARKRVVEKFTLTPRLWQYLQDYKAKHEAKGNGFGYGLVGPKQFARTLSARYYKDGSEILVKQRMPSPPRRLTPRECARLMGFPDTFKIPVSDTRAYKQFGNSVVVPVIREVARLVRPFIDRARNHQPELGLATD
jgi:DNA (cytosine-5)-methyltransferase 1